MTGVYQVLRLDHLQETIVPWSNVDVNERIDQSESDNRLVRAVVVANRYLNTTTRYASFLEKSHDRSLYSIGDRSLRPKRTVVACVKYDDSLFKKERKPKRCNDEASAEESCNAPKSARTKKTEATRRIESTPVKAKSETKKLIPSNKEEKRTAKSSSSSSSSSSLSSSLANDSSLYAKSSISKVPPAYSLFLEMWSMNLLEKAIQIKNKFTADPSVVYSREFGPSIWSSECFVDDSDSAVEVPPEPMPSSAIEGKARRSMQILSPI
jgi:hypothetical protein